MTVVFSDAGRLPFLAATSVAGKANLATRRVPAFWAMGGWQAE